MATPREVALDHYSDRQSFVDAAAEAAAAMWRDVDPKAISKTWAAQVPEMAAVVAGAQMGAARLSDDYLDDVLDAEDVDPFSVSDVDPAGFRGASDGRGLLTLLANPAIVALMAIKDGLDIARAMTAGAANLDMLVRTQVADAGRAADQVALTARPAAKGYVRMAVGKTCARCLLLSGKFYLWNAGFQRHPRCDCIHVPAGDARAARIPGPRALYDNLTTAERTRAGFTLADQRALADGADFGQVVNAHRGMFVAGGRKFTREGTTKRGFAGSRLEGRPRLTPDEIFRQAGPDRDEALRLLHENGYLLDPPVPVPRVSPALPSPTSGSGATGGAAASAPAIRPALQSARMTVGVERAFREEFERITGRPLPGTVEFAGSVVTAREHAEGLLRGVERFPEVHLTDVRIASIKPGSTEYASAAGSTVSFNPAWLSVSDRKRYIEAAASDVSSGWHPRGTGSPVGIAVHEFGHVLDLGTLGQARRREIQALLEGRAAARDAAIEAQRAAGDLIDIEDWVAGSGVDGLIHREISQYATKNHDELVAEAFADVILNGPSASQLSQDIFKLIEHDYLHGPFDPITIVSASEPAPIAVGASLSKLTIPQLKALAKDRLIRLPPRARKAEILALLDPPAAGTVTKAQVRADARAAARERNRQIEARGPVEDMLAEVDELLGKSASTEVMLEHLDAVTGVPAADLASLRKAVQTGDRTKIRAAITRLGNKQGLKATAPAGKKVAFDPDQHELFGGGDLAAGTQVVVVRRGTTLTIDGQTIVFNRAKVAVVQAPPQTQRPSLDSLFGEFETAGRRVKVPTERIAAWVDGEYAGLEVRVTRASWAPPGPAGGLRFSGTIRDPATGKAIGTFSRAIQRDRDGTLHAVHELLKIKRQYQGSGFQAQFNGNLLDWYRKSGLGYVKVGANIDIGGYAWASAGYDAADAHEALGMYSRVYILLREVRGEARHAADWLDANRDVPGFTWTGPSVFPPSAPWTQERLRKTFPGLTDEQIAEQLRIGQEFVDSLAGKTFGADDFPSFYELSQLGRWPGAGKDDMWIGKQVMLGSAWLGILRL